MSPSIGPGTSRPLVCGRYHLQGQKDTIRPVCLKAAVPAVLSNVFCHGNDRNPQEPIRIYVQVGDKGILVKLCDTWAGFDVRRTLERFRTGKAYSSVAGKGVRRMAESPDFGVFFNRNGNGFHLIYLFEGDLRRLKSLEGRGQALPRPLEHAEAFLPATDGTRSDDLKQWIHGAVIRRAPKAIQRIDIVEALGTVYTREIIYYGFRRE